MDSWCYPRLVRRLTEPRVLNVLTALEGGLFLGAKVSCEDPIAKGPYTIPLLQLYCPLATLHNKPPGLASHSILYHC